MQFADKEGNHLAAAVGEYREWEYRRFDAERGGGIQGILLADEQRIADFEAISEFQHFVAIVHRDPYHGHVACGPFGMQGFEQRYFAAAGCAPGGPEVDDQGLAAKGRDRGGFALLI